jgi:hypothetical protein
VSVTSTLSVGVTPWRTLGNWFSPLSRRQVFAAAVTSLNTTNLAVSWDNAPLVRTVRCRTVANTLSIGFDVRRWSQGSARRSQKVSKASRSFTRQVTAFSYLAACLSTADQVRLGVITRAGDETLRSVLVVGATAVIRQAQRSGKASPWLAALHKRKSPKLAAVALANNTARFAWKMMLRMKKYIVKSASAVSAGAV